MRSARYSVRSWPAHLPSQRHPGFLYHRLIMASILRAGNLFSRICLCLAWRKQALSNTAHPWFCVLSLADELLQAGNFPCAEDQGQFVREPLLLSNDRLPVFFLFRFFYQLHRLPVRDMAHFPFPEDSVKHSGRAEQPNVPSMQGREWAASYVCHLCEKHCGSLAIGRRFRQQVFYLV